MKIRIYTIVKPTEDPEKVKKAVENIFNGEVVIVDEGNGYYRVEGISTSRKALNKLYNMIRMEQVIAATRSYLLKNTRRNVITILLHKQAAYVNKLSFIDSDRESPLGAIKLVIEADDPKEIIDWLAPKIEERRTSRRKRGT